MKKINFTLILLLLVNLLHAQNPLVKQWDYRFGGNQVEALSVIQQTRDAGYIIGGYSFSGIGGDKTQENWDIQGHSPDYWILKIDSLGNKEWDKNFGGVDFDELFCLQQTNDGGYIIGGYSNSDSSGDKTEHTVACADFWILKLDSLGNKEWNKVYGGSVGDVATALQQTMDGGFILGGYTTSGISGNKTSDNRGITDYWIVKIDFMGNKEWDKDFGGTKIDELHSLCQTSDGGYILGGSSNSGANGDKTQASEGNYDYWIIKTDSLGNKEWDKAFGGINFDAFYSLHQTPDGGYILGGLSYSDIGGSKTTPLHGGAHSDYWIIKTDAIGNKIWERDFGGDSLEDRFGNISLTIDGGYLLAGSSYSNVSGDKTENNLGPKQTWVIKLDSLGNKQWDKTLLNDGGVDNCYAIQAMDGGYVIVNDNNGIVAGDKTQACWGGYYTDYWIIKFSDPTFTTGINNTLNSISEISVSPNPFYSETLLEVSPAFANAKLHLYNSLGSLIREDKISNQKTFVFHRNELLNGIYFLQLINDRGQKMTEKLIVK